MQHSISQLKELEQKYSWHMMSSMQDYQKNPCIIQSGQGSWLLDIEGNSFLDGNASMWTSTFGHKDPCLDAALQDQISILSHSTKVCRGHVPATLLSAKLAELTNFELTRSFFTNNGSTAIEAAIKMSLQYWKNKGDLKKNKIVSLIEGHHGFSFGVMSLSSIHKHNIPNCLNVSHFSTPEELDSILDDTVACIIMESKVQAIRNRGIHILPQGFMHQVHQVCKKHDVHLILDEVFTGFFRTGPLFACQSDHFFPDFLCLGKSITAGYLPMGVTMTREPIFNLIDQTTFYHGHTYGGNPLACRVALENIRKLQDAQKSGFLVNQVNDFQSLFDSYFTENQYIRNPRRIGMIAAIDLNKAMGTIICQQAHQNKVLIRSYKDTIFFIPALNMKKDDINYLFKTIKKCIIHQK